MRLPTLLLTLAVTILAFALFGANAKVAMAWDTAPPAPAPTCTEAGTVSVGALSGSKSFCVHINEPRTVPDPTLCNSSTIDPDTNSSNPPELRTQQCGHVLFGTTVAGTVSGSITYPEAPMNLFSLGICQLDATGTVCEVVYDQNSPNCTFTGPTGTGNVTVSLTCTGLPAGNYELLVTPFFYDSCADVFSLLAPGCPSFVGIGITGTLSFTPQNAGGSGGGTGGLQNTNNKITGGGQFTASTGQANFSIEGFVGQTKGHVRLSIRGGCSIKADSVQTVFLAPNRAKISAFGRVKSANGQWDENVEVYAEDNGEGKSQPQPDRIQFTSAHCSAPLSAVSKGNIQAHFYG
jgi:hypothetical protein